MQNDKKNHAIIRFFANFRLPYATMYIILFRLLFLGYVVLVLIMFKQKLCRPTFFSESGIQCCKIYSHTYNQSKNFRSNNDDTKEIIFKV